MIAPPPTPIVPIALELNDVLGLRKDG